MELLESIGWFSARPPLPFHRLPSTLMHQPMAFLSEWGNDALDFYKRGAEMPTTHFIVTAVLEERTCLLRTGILSPITLGRVIRYFQGVVDSLVTLANKKRAESEMVPVSERAAFFKDICSAPK